MLIKYNRKKGRSLFCEFILSDQYKKVKSINLKSPHLEDRPDSKKNIMKAVQ